MSEIFSQETALRNHNTSYNRVKSQIVKPDANKLCPQSMWGDWDDSSVESETPGKKDSIPQVVVDTSMMQLEVTNQGSLYVDRTVERSSDNSQWF